MKTDVNDILDRVDRRDSFTVPAGFFDDFERKMAAQLPYRPEIEEDHSTPSAHRGWWQAIRPYAYMAAMFAGIWCMLQMFNVISPAPSSIVPMSENPILAEAFGNDEFVSTYLISDMDQWDLVSDDDDSDDFDFSYVQ